MEMLEKFIKKSVFLLFRSLVLMCSPLERFKNEMVRRNPHASGIFFSALSLIAFVVLFSVISFYCHRQDEKYREFWNQYASAAK